MKGVILYGPPASGKDTLSSELSHADSRCQPFRRLKAGQGKVETYRMVDASHIADLNSRHEIAWMNCRYGAVYAVDTPELRNSLVSGIPILHLGQVEAIPAVKAAIPEASWLTVELWCSRMEAINRLRTRNPSDLEERLRVWDGTPHLSGPDLSIDTGQVDPRGAAELILAALCSSPGG